MDSPFLETFCVILASKGIATLRFEFAYMAARRTTGKKRPAPKAETLKPEYLAAVEACGREETSPLFIGGKSLGGRVASMAAAELHGAGRIKGLVCLGYPFHAPSTPDKLRTDHLLNLGCPALIVQGSRDPFGSQSLIEGLTLSPAVRFHWADDGDHDLGPRGASGFTRKGNLEAAATAIGSFAAGQS
jgi:uncharacterized protein